MLINKKEYFFYSTNRKVVMEIASLESQSQMEPGTDYGGPLLPCQQSGMALL